LIFSNIPKLPRELFIFSGCGRVSGVRYFPKSILLAGIQRIKLSTDWAARVICHRNAVSKPRNAGQMNTIPEPITDGQAPRAEETALETTSENPALETSEEPKLINGVDAVRYRKAVRRILSRPKGNKVPDPWALSTIGDKLEIAKIFSKETVARVQLVDGLSVKQRLDAAIALGEEMINGTGAGNLNAELRLKGIAIIAGAAKVSGELSEQNMRLAEKAATKGESGNGVRRKNLPPSTGVEITTGEGDNKVTTRVVATNGTEVS
jgi:hypothetical protein